MSQLLSCFKIEKSIAGRTLFKDLNLGVEEGDMIGLVGPNGAGKSTLLKILSRQTTPDAGDVIYKKGIKIGFLQQSPEFEENQTILQAILSLVHDEHDHLADAYAWISKLQLSQFGENFLVSELSGGWKKRVALARELILNPDLLLLDEPTNHLDVSSILWLEEFLNEAMTSKKIQACIVITHDRLFLQRISNKIFDLDFKNPNYLLSVSGGYVKYLEAKEILINGQEQAELKMKNTLRRETEWLRRGAIARQTKQKARIERASDLKENVEDISLKNMKRKVQIDFKDNEKGPQKLIQADQITKSYGGKLLFEKVDLLITPKTRLALLGDNGSGKSTLIKVLIGDVEPDFGKIQKAERLKVSYFEQNRETLDPQKSLYKNICPEGDYVYFQGNYVHAKSYLERFLFSRHQMDLPVAQLSGGEQSRLRIAQMMLMESNVLILDEPTNDLDISTLEILAEAIDSYPGAVILVTHDRYFMDQVAHDILAFPSMIKFSDYMQWESWFEEDNDKKIQQEKEAKEKQNQNLKNESTAPVKKQRLSFKEKFELENMEENILKMEERIQVLQSELEKPEVASDAGKVQQYYQELGELQSKVEYSYQRWSELDARKSD